MDKVIALAETERMKCERDSSMGFNKIISNEETKEPKKVRMRLLLTWFSPRLIWVKWCFKSNSLFWRLEWMKGWTRWALIIFLDTPLEMRSLCDAWYVFSFSIQLLQSSWGSNAVSAICSSFIRVASSSSDSKWHLTISWKRIICVPLKLSTQSATIAPRETPILSLVSLSYQILVWLRVTPPSTSVASSIWSKKRRVKRNMAFHNFLLRK